MKNAKKQINLAMVAVLVFTLLNTPAPAVAGTPEVAATPVEYTLSVDDKGVSLWAYEIDGGVYFKLRDVAMALSGTEKQFDVLWIPENKEVDLSAGNAYTPVGGELSRPDRAGNPTARYTDCSIRSGSGWGNILAYLVNDTHYVKLSDVAAVMKLASSYDREKHTAQIVTSPETGLAKETGAVLDNITLSDSGNSYSLDEDGNVVLYYNNGEIKSKAPLVLKPAGSDDASGQGVDDAGFYISEEKTAIAYGGRDGDPVYVVTSDNLGKTWERSEVIAQNVGVSQLYIGFYTQNDGWLVLGSFHGMGNEDHYIYRTADGGKTWEQIGNPNDIYPRVMTGAGFATGEIGFLSYRYEFEDFEPAICRTLDGGYSWEKLYVELPEEFDGYNKTPLSPVFHGADGLYPIKLSRDGGDNVTIYLNSTDYGKTWTYDEAYNLAHRQAQKNASGLQFKTKGLAYEKLPALDETQVAKVLEERTENGMTQVLYYKPGDDGQFYLYLTIDGVSYDLGYMGYGYGGPENKPSRLESWGLNKTEVSEDSPVYMFVRLHGVAYVSSAYITILDGVPYLLYEFDGWGIQYDIDGDGAVETTANAGGSTSQDFILYEWDMDNKSIRYVRLKEVFHCDVTLYDVDENLFYAESRNNTTGKWEQSAYEYKDGEMLEVGKLAP